MPMRFTGCFLLLLLLSVFSQAQQQSLSGRVHKKGGREVLQSVSVHNINQERFNLSDQGGNYRIDAAEGDLVVFSSVGYQPDTLLVTNPMLTGGYDISLEPKVVALPTITVGSTSNYQADSIERRKEYEWVYGKSKEKLVNKDRKGGDGVGVSLSIPNMSTADRQRERLKKRLLQEEEDYYIDSRFNREYVARLTHLKGDSLQQFMVKYRPTYQYCRAATNTDMLLWINDGIIKFRKKE